MRVSQNMSSSGGPGFSTISSYDPWHRDSEGPRGVVFQTGPALVALPRKPAHGFGREQVQGSFARAASRECSF